MRDNSANWFVRHKILSGVLVLVVLVIIISVASGGGKKNTATNAAATTQTTVDHATDATVPPSTAPAPTAPPTTPAPTIPPTTVSLQEQNAIRAARQYLGMGTGFSQVGLIQQLSSSAGDGYPLAVATAAVDSLNVDYNAQAALAAKGYLQTSSFSCSGMVQQLDSAAGSQFTPAQAQYGATQVGIC